MNRFKMKRLKEKVPRHALFREIPTWTVSSILKHPHYSTESMPQFKKPAPPLPAVT